MLNLLTLVIVSFVIVGLTVMGLIVAISLVVDVTREIRATITSNKAAKATTKESVMPVTIIVALFALSPVSAFAATTTAMEPVMSIEITHLKLAFFFACVFAARFFLEEFMLNRKIKALTAALKVANRRADRAEAQLEEANACLETSTANATIAKLTADNAQLVTQTTWLSTLANNLSKVVAGTVTTLIAMLFALPAHAAAPFEFAPEAGGFHDLMACAILFISTMIVVSAAVIALLFAASYIINTAIKAITMENVMKFVVVAAMFLVPSIANAAELTANTHTEEFKIAMTLAFAIVALGGIGALTVCRHEIAAGIIVTFSIFAIFPVGIIGTEMGIDKAILTNVISGILIWVMLAFGVLQLCMMPGRKADKAAAAAKKEQWNMIIRKADEKRENARLDAWYDRAEYADSLNTLAPAARVAVLRGKPYHTSVSVVSATDKACGYRRALLTR